MQNKTQIYRVSLPFQLLKTFTEKELTSFGKLLDSGYLSANESLGKLLCILKKFALHHQNFDSSLQIDIYKVLFIKEDVGEKLKAAQGKKLNRLMNELLNAAEKFLMFEDLKNTDVYDAKMLYPKLIDRNQLLLYSKRIKAIEKKLHKDKKRGANYYNQCYHIQQEKARLFYINNTLSKEDNYDTLQYYVDVNYLLQKLQYHLAKITLQRRYAHKAFNYKAFDALQTLLNLPEYKSNPLIQLYLLNIQLVEREDEVTFLALSKLLKEKQDIIPADFLNIFYINLTNFCTYQIANGDLAYYQYLFGIYNDMDASNLLVRRKFIELALLKNIITTACSVDAFDWAIEKLDHYSSYVPKAIRNSVFEYNRGIIAFNQQKYNEALTHFANVKKIDNNYEFSLRIAQLQCFYETDLEYEAGTQQMINSLREYINQNKKLAKRQKMAYINFIFVFNKLYKLKNTFGKRNQSNKIKKILPGLKNQLQQYSLIWRKPWLLRKIKSLETNID